MDRSQVPASQLPFLLILDRDGTVIEDKGYLSDPEGIVLEQGAIEGLQAMVAAGAIPVIITNQSGVGRGYFSMTAVDAIHDRLDELLAKQGISIQAYLVCPHGPDDECGCRKPRTALALRAAAETGLPLSEAYVIGDKLSDTGLAAATGATGILVRTGEGDKHAATAEAQGFLTAANLAEAAQLVCQTLAARNSSFPGELGHG